MVLVCRHGLHDQLHVRSQPQQLGNRIGRTSQHASLQKNNVRRVALDGGAQILQRIGLRHHADIVFQGKDFANAHAVNSLGIRKNNANGAGLDRLIEVLALGVFVQNFHSWLR